MDLNDLTVMEFEGWKESEVLNKESKSHDSCWTDENESLNVAGKTKRVL